MLDRSGTAKARRIAVAASIDPARENEWRLFAGLARYVASKAPVLDDWQKVDAVGQLAFVWAHASKLAIALMDERGRVMVAALRRIATDEAQRDWAISAAQRFAKAFVGLPFQYRKRRASR